MNIFLLSWILKNCAIYHCDKHVIKQILETTQLLGTTHHMVNSVLAEKYMAEGKIYKKTHYNHPLAIWVRECRENYIWLCHLGLALCKEYVLSDNTEIHQKFVFTEDNVLLLKISGSFLILIE